jgi:transketolase
VTSDGEHDAGLHWEAVLAAAKYGLENLICIVDRNFIQIDGRTEEVMPLESLENKYLAFNWHVIKCDGNDLNQILEAFEEAKATKGGPTVIVAHTIPGRGVSFMENDYHWHSQTFKNGEVEAALNELRNAKL